MAVIPAVQEPVIYATGQMSPAWRAFFEELSRGGVGYLTQDAADLLYQAIGTYLDTATADTLYQALDGDLTAIAALSTTSFGRSLLEAADAAGLRTLAGLGTIATQAASAVTITGGSVTGITDLAVADGGTGVSTLTGLVKGNGASAFSAAAAGTDYYAPGSTDVAVADGGTGASTASAARTNLGLGSLATLNTVNGGNWSGTDLAVTDGGTGASTAAAARTNLNLPTGITPFTADANATLRWREAGTFLGPVAQHTATLTADRFLYLRSSTLSEAGDIVKIYRTGGGAFNVKLTDYASLGLIKNLATGTWAECVYDGTNWLLIAYGSL